MVKLINWRLKLKISVMTFISIWIDGGLHFPGVFFLNQLFCLLWNSFWYLNLMLNTYLKSFYDFLSTKSYIHVYNYKVYHNNSVHTKNFCICKIRWLWRNINLTVCSTITFKHLIESFNWSITGYSNFNVP